MKFEILQGTIRIKKIPYIELRGAYFNSYYSVTSYYVVQRRFLWFFWIPLKAFDYLGMAESWVEAYKEMKLATIKDTNHAGR